MKVSQNFRKKLDKRLNLIAQMLSNILNERIPIETDEKVVGHVVIYNKMNNRVVKRRVGQVHIEWEMPFG